MTPPPSLDRIRRAWQARAAGAREQALFALLLVTVTAGAHLSRLGTTWARGVVGVAILVVLVMQVVVRIKARREGRNAFHTLRHVVLPTDPALGARALRALGLVERPREDESEVSSELASLHLSRLVDRVSSDAVGLAAHKYAQRLRGAAVALLCGVSVAIVMGPSRIVEGLDVLSARHGRAPLAMGWLGFPRLVAVPPAYTHETEHSLVFGTSTALPKGTVVTIRGVPRYSDRELVFTDGAREEPFADDGSGGLVARYTVQGPVSLRVAARFGGVRIDGDESLDVDVVPDARPSVELEGAPKTLRLADLERIDVRWTARDDHGLREVDLVLRSGAREERRVLGRFDGETRIERGGRVVTSRDAFLRRMFLPVSITVEAKDNDPFDGPKWSVSSPIVIIPPDVGQPEAERLAALVGIRDELVDLLKWSAAAASEAPAPRMKAWSERLSDFETKTLGVLGATYSGTTFSKGLRAFVEGQLDRLRAMKDVGQRAIEDGVLAVDVAVSSLGDRDAATVAKRLGDVAEEAAVSARGARDSENRRGSSRLDAAIGILDTGADRLATLADLGLDLGGVTHADTGRIRRARDAGDLTHAELAALHLAARLRRPAPSFGATTGSHHGRGAESGQSHGSGGEGDEPPPSSADEEFDRAADAVSELAEQHGNALHGLEQALEDAKKIEPTDAERGEAKELADKIREGVSDLPLPGEEFGSPRGAAALAREHARAAAHALDDLALKDAADSAETALGTLDQTEKQLDADDSLHSEFARARRALHAALDWTARKLSERQSTADNRAKASVEQAGDTERDLALRAEKLAADSNGQEGALPRETAAEIGKAGSVMREAVSELAAGHGDRGANLEREAQRLLDEARLGRSTEEPQDKDERDSKGDEPPEAPPSEHHATSRGPIALGGGVPGPDALGRAEEFRRRVLEGLGKEKSERLSSAVRRYAEGLLK